MTLNVLELHTIMFYFPVVFFNPPCTLCYKIVYIFPRLKAVVPAMGIIVQENLPT